MQFNHFKNIFCSAALLIGISSSFAVQAQNIQNTQQLNGTQPVMSIDGDTALSQLKAQHVSNKVIKVKVTEKLEQQLAQYQSLGLYNNVKEVIFSPQINYGADNTGYESKIVSLNISPQATLNHLKLSTIGFPSKGTLEQQETYDLQKTLAHELGHLQFASDQTLLNKNNSPNNNVSAIVNQQITTDLQFSLDQKSINTSYQFVHENVADAYGELAYMKLHNFDQNSIDSLKTDLDTRIKDNQENEFKNGKYKDSHDTVKTLEILLKLVSDPETKKKLQQLPGEAFDGLAKSIVFNSYQDYLANEDIKNNIKQNSAEGNVDTQTLKLYNEVIKLPTKINLGLQINKLRDSVIKSNNDNLGIKPK